MVYGLSFKSLPDDERDRVDMAVERMIPADLELLQLVARWLAAGGCTAYLKPNELRLVPAFAESDFATAIRNPTFVADPGAFATLQMLGCIYCDSNSAMPGWQILNVSTTALGELVLRAIDEVRPGLGASPPTAV
jgi:hypothetical protein